MSEEMVVLLAWWIGILMVVVGVYRIAGWEWAVVSTGLSLASFSAIKALAMSA